jgi:hypothetical protein
MAHLTIENGNLTVTMQGIDKILALRGHLSVPLMHIRGVDVRPPEAFEFYHGFKIGTNLPGVVTAGTFITEEGHVFYDVHDPERTIGVDLDGEAYQRLIIEVDAGASPEDVAARIYGAIRQSRM